MHSPLATSRRVCQHARDERESRTRVFIRHLWLTVRRHHAHGLHRGNSEIHIDAFHGLSELGNEHREM